MMDNEMTSNETNGSTPPSSVSEVETATEAPTETVAEKPVKAAKPKKEKAPKPAKAKVDPETEETVAEIVERAQAAAKKGSFAEGSNAYRRAAKLADGEEKKTFTALADQLAAQAKEKGQPMKTKKAKKEKAAKKAKPAKKAKSVKAAKPKKAKGEPKHKYPVTAAEKRQSAERTAQFMKSSAKREEPNNDEAKLWKSIGIGKETSTDKMADLFKGSGDSAKRHSRVRNALRWLRASRKFKSTAVKGTYKRIA